jgi:hypothetical protein
VLEDHRLLEVARYLSRTDRFEERMAQVLRRTYDQIYDGVNTGRYRWDQLRKTEKTHFGSLVEINIQREFEFQDGTVLDFLIAGVEVDCKFSQDRFAWMIPVEAVDQVCLVVTADETNSHWSAGLVRAERSFLGAPNRDMKRRLNTDGRSNVAWLWRDADLPPNILMQIPRALADTILGLPSGQQRVNELFRRVQGRLIPRGTVATVARQFDYMKRVRYNGGARSHLRSKGIVIFGQSGAHSELADKLGLPVPSRGESLSIRLTQAAAGEGVRIDGSWWRVASANDAPYRAPLLPGP